LGKVIQRKYSNILNAVIALASAWFGYRTVKKAATAKSIQSRQAILKVEDPSVRQQPWNMRRSKWLGALGALPAIILGLVAWIEFDAGFAILYLAMGLGLLVLIAFLRSEPPSRTRKSVRLELLLPIAKAMDASLKAVTSLGAEVARYDATAGILVAKKGMSWRSFGEIITVKAVPLDLKRCEISIESDVLQITVLVDWGANRRNVRQIQSALVSGAPTTE
jgi:hypothetical protein